MEEVLTEQGKIDFTDQRQSRPASIALSPLNLTVRNLSTLPKAAGRHSLEATLDDGGTIRVTGEIALNPVLSQGSFSFENVRAATAWRFLRDALTVEQPEGKLGVSGEYHDVDGEINSSDPKDFTNISLVFRNVEMSRLTPYSGQFAGRRIDSGKLSVDLKYKIDRRQLAGENRFVIERLTLGEKVQSPDAVNLPLDLAVALLKDSKGVIDLGLPVSGTLDSLEFSYGALIWKAVVNLLTKIVTSPFRALAALLPGGADETLNTIAFQPGRSEVPPPEREKLARLAVALKQRPQLDLAVQGRYNPEIDMMELRKANLRRTLASLQGQRREPGEDPGPVDYSSPETGKALATLFTERLGAFDRSGKDSGRADHGEAFDRRRWKGSRK